MSASPTNRRPSQGYDSLLSPSASSFQPSTSNPAGAQSMAHSNSNQSIAQAATSSGRGGRGGGPGRGALFNNHMLQQIQSQIAPPNHRSAPPPQQQFQPHLMNRSASFNSNQSMPQPQHSPQSQPRLPSLNNGMPQPFYPQGALGHHQQHQQQASMGGGGGGMNMGMVGGGGGGMPMPSFPPIQPNQPGHASRPSLSMAMPHPQNITMPQRNPSFNMLSPSVSGMASPLPIPGSGGRNNNGMPPSPLGGPNQNFQFGNQSPQRSGSGNSAFNFGAPSQNGTSPNYMNRQASVGSNHYGMPVTPGLLPPSNPPFLGGPSSSNGGSVSGDNHHSDGRADSNNGGRGGKKKRSGPPVHTPLKTTGHNSTPSVSIMNPAAFAASLGLGGKVGQASGSKRKATVKLPKEGPGPEDETRIKESNPEEVLISLEESLHDDGDPNESEEQKRIKNEKKLKKKEYLSSRTRCNWKVREPLKTLQESQSPLKRDFNTGEIISSGDLLPFLPSFPKSDLSYYDEEDDPSSQPGSSQFSEFIYSREPYPANENQNSELPDTIDIYLPGKGAWEEYKTFRELEKRDLEAKRANGGEYTDIEAEIGQRMDDDENDAEAKFGERNESGWGLGTGGDGATFGLGNQNTNTNHQGRSLSISSPADPNMVSYKLSRYLQSQSAISTSDQPFSDDAASMPNRFSDNLPPQLREAALAQLSRNSKDNSPAPNGGNFTSHGYTMSLGLPSSGGPFGPAALSALGLGASEMARTGSDQGDRPPALGARPTLERGHSADGGVPNNPSSSSSSTFNPMSSSFTPKTNQESREQNKPSSGPAWKDLARGFGYDIEEVDEENLSASVGGPSAQHSRNPSRNVEAYIGGKSIEGNLSVPREDEDEDDDPDADLRTNPSEDADGESDLDDADNSNSVQQRGMRHHQGISTTGMSDFAGPRNERQVENYDDDFEDSQISFSGESDGEDSDSDLGSLPDRSPPSSAFSNPSDLEEARAQYREQRALRAEQKAAEKIRRSREKRQEKEKNRNRAYTGGTLASSAIGADDWNWQADQRRENFVDQRRRSSNQDVDIISNPSDEEDERDEKDTFGGSADDPRESQDFAFPRNRESNAPAPDSDPLKRESDQISSGLHAATLGRKNGRRTHNNENQDPSLSAHDKDINPHFRLPSIHNSSFGGSSAFGGLAGSANGVGNSAGGTSTQLKATAPSFTPGNFTFTAPSDAPRLPQLPSSQVVASSPLDYPNDASLGAQGERERDHGREKRFRHEGWSNPIDEGATDVPSHHANSSGFTSPPRPVASAASIEGPLRGESQANPPPFNGGSGSRNVEQHQFGSGLRPPQSNFSFKPDAPVFTPTIGRATSGTGASRRGGIPDFGFGPVDPAPAPAPAPRPVAPVLTPFGNASNSSAVPLGVPASDFTFVPPGNKAIPIKKPEEDLEQEETEDRERGGKHARRDLDHSPNQAPKDKENNTLRYSPHRGNIGLSGSAATRSNSARKPLDSVFDRVNDHGISPPVAIPGRSRTHQHPAASISKARGAAHRNLSIDSAASSNSAFGPPRRNRDQVRNAMNARMSGESNEDDEDDEEASDDEEVEDIIEELAERMDKALEGWAGKILDEVTIMGQVRPPSGLPLASAPARLDAQERELLVKAFGNHVQATFEDYFEKFSQKLTSIQPSVSSDGLGDESQRTIKAIENQESSAAPSSAKASSGHAPLDGQGEMDFDYVTEVLDSKIANLKRDLMAAFDTALPRALEAIPRDVTSRPAIEATPSAPPSHPALGESRPSELSESASEKLVQLLVSRIQPIVEKASDLAEQAAAQRRRTELTQTLEPMFEENLIRSQTKAAAERQEVAHLLTEALSSKIEDWERNLGELRSALDDQMQVALVKGILPHLETLRQEPTDPDVVAARVTEILLPMMADRKERDEIERRDSSDTLANLSRTSTLTPEQVSDLTIEKITPIINGIKTEPIDMDAIVLRVGEIVGKQSIEHLVDLNPVIALLEPLVTKQEEARKISKQIMERQREVESTLAVLPGAINAKTEIFLSATQQTHDKQASILEQLEKMSRLHESTQHRADELDEQRDDLLRRLDAARQEAHDRQADADEAKAELSAASGYSSTLKEELTRLETRLDEVLKQEAETSAELSELRLREAAAKDKAHDAERRIQEMESNAKESKLVNESSEAQRSMLQNHIDQLTSELNEARADRAREREAAAQATAEALARADRAEKASQESRKRADERIDEASRIERAAQDEVRAASERAAKAEGELTSLEKRLNDQENKVTTLQQVNATQKQKAAQSQQRLSEAEKKTKDFEKVNEELANARGRTQELESRVAEKEQLDERLRASQDSELRLREELATYHTRFLELEKDLIMMKESLVGRDELEASQAELAASREEVARLNGQLAERDRERNQPIQSMNGNYPSNQDLRHLQSQQQHHQDGFFEGDDGHGGNLPQYLRSNHAIHRGALGSYASRYATGNGTPSESELSGNDSFYHEEPNYDGDYPTQTPKMAPRSISHRSASVVSNSNTSTRRHQKVEVARNDDGWWS